MERVEAQPLHEVWHDMSWLKKGLLVIQIVDLMAQIFRIEMSDIGSLYLSDHDQSQQKDSGDATEFTVGETVLPPFFKSSNITLDILRGPFTSIQAYINFRIQLAQLFASTLDLSNEDDLEHYKDIQAVLSGTQSVVPMFFPTTTSEPTILSKRNISTSNVLVSPTGSLVNIVDWECVTFLPAIFAAQIPQSLKASIATYLLIQCTISATSIIRRTWHCTRRRV
jgi:hypothetical protein